MRYQLKIFISIVLLASSIRGVSQISSPNADFITITNYSGADPINHPVYVFYSSPGEVISPILKASRPESQAFTFEWSKYDSLSLVWDFITSESGVTQSELSNLDEGGYKVRVFDGISIDTTYIAWLFINNLEVNVLSNSSDQLIFGKYFCGKLILDATINLDPFWYYNPVSLERTVYQNDHFFKWTTDHSVFEIRPDNVGLSEKGVFDPPAEDMWIILTATDSTGMTDVDSVFYDTVEVEAEFSMEFFDKVDTEDYVEAPAPTEDDAPLKIRYTNKSLNGYSFEWIFTDTSNFDFPIRETEITENVDYRPEYTYKIPDDYYPALVAKSEENCIDTFKLTEPIVITPSDLTFPNWFRPIVDDELTYFKPITVESIKEFQIRIYSRTGNLVYRADITDLYSWPGWNGDVLNSSRPATPGVYYFIIAAQGYDGEKYPKEPYKGFVYLVREKE